MKITLHHLGPIEQADIDLRPLTVFIGRNNTGKTWATNVIASVFGLPGQKLYEHTYDANRTIKKIPSLDLLLQQVIDKGEGELDLLQFATEHGEKYMDDIAHLAPKLLRNYLKSDHLFKGLEVNLVLGEVKEIFLERIKTFAVVNEQSGTLSAMRDNSQPILRIQNKDKSLSPFWVKGFIYDNVFGVIRQAIYRNIYPFPTERLAWVVQNFSQLKQSLDGFVDDGHEDYFLGWMVEAATANDLNKESTKQYRELAHELEGILEGKINFVNNDTEFMNQPEKELRFQINDKLDLEMSAASSMVQGLSALVIYLRYLAQHGELIIIDEPEMNLHPEAQVQLMEFLAMLVNAGLHVLITTHSPYMVDHLANLMAAAKSENKAEASELFFLERTEAFISQDKVSVYLFENGTATNVVDDDGIIHWGTFGEISNYLSDVYAHLI